LLSISARRRRTDRKVKRQQDHEGENGRRQQNHGADGPAAQGVGQRG
jgi:hypothetical protein